LQPAEATADDDDPGVRTHGAEATRTRTSENPCTLDLPLTAHDAHRPEAD
jgi:hypothetical protein